MGVKLCVLVAVVALGLYTHGVQGACSVIAIARSGAYSAEQKSVAKAVAEAFADSDGCENVTANAKATAEAFATATAKAIAETKVKAEGDTCSENSIGYAKAKAKAFATAISVAIAEAIAEATNSQGDNYAVAAPEDIKKVVEAAIAIAESTVEGTGEANSKAVAEAVAESTANAIATAIAEVECDGEQVDFPFEGRSADDDIFFLPPPTSDPCQCSESAWTTGVKTGRPGCKQHAKARNPKDEGFFCYVVGGEKCSKAKASKKYKGAYWIDCA